MRRSFSILFLFLAGLNTIGYYGLLLMAKKEMTDQILQKIDENANEISGNLILKIPMGLPSPTDSKEYERTNGEVYYDGEVYRFVKQRSHRDTLFVVCLRDHEGTVVKNMISDYSMTFSNEPCQHGPGLRLVASLAKYYVLSDQSAVVAPWCQEQRRFFSCVADVYPFSLTGSIFHPPQLG